MNIELIQELTSRSPEAKAMLETLAGRPKQPRNGRTEIRRIGIDTRKRGYLITSEQLQEFTETLQEAGLGHIEQKKNELAYFVFNRKIDVKDVLAELILDSMPPKPQRISKPVVSAPAETKKVLILPSGKEIAMEIPEGLLKEDAQALCKMIMRRAR